MLSETPPDRWLTLFGLHRRIKVNEVLHGGRVLIVSLGDQVPKLPEQKQEGAPLPFEFVSGVFVLVIADNNRRY